MKIYGGCFGLLIFLTLSGILGAFLWPYSINTWLVFFHKPPTIMWWHGFLLGYLPYFGQIIIPVAVITWVLMLFLV